MSHFGVPPAYTPGRSVASFLCWAICLSVKKTFEVLVCITEWFYASAYRRQEKSNKDRRIAAQIWVVS